MSISSPPRVRIPQRFQGITLTDIIYNEYELPVDNRPGLRFNEQGHFEIHDEDPIISMDNVEIAKYDEDGICWNFDTTNLGIGIDAGTTISGSRETSFREKYKIRHEFVCESLGRENTDVSLRTVFEEEGDEDDEITPDFCWMDHNGFYNVVEVATTRNDTEEGLQRVYNTKAFKYRYALETRALRGKVVTFTIIVVSTNRVLSSIKLPRVIFSEMIVRMRIGLALENLAKSKGLSLESDEPEMLHAALSKEIKRKLELVEFKKIQGSPLAISPDYLQSLEESVDEKSIVELYLNGILEVKEDCKSQKIDESFHARKVDEFIKESNMGARKSVLKPVLNLPLLCPATTDSNVDVPDKLIEWNGHDIESKLWCIAFDNYRSERTRNIDEDPTTLIREALETSQEKIEEYQSARKQQRSKYHRVNIASELNSSEKELLAEQGLWAKKYKNDTFYKERRKASQTPFSYETSVSDIDEFLTDSGFLFDEVSDKYTPDEMVYPLLKLSNDIVDNTNSGLETVKKWCKTKLVRSMQFISDIAMELCISNKQHCKSGSAILKKLRYFDAYILIFPTKSNEHMFFSIYSENAEILHGLPFRKVIQFKDSIITTLVSVKQSKLENWSSAASSVISLMSFWSNFYDFQTEDPLNFKNHLEARKMLLLSLIIRLEDKAQTEECVTLVRYMYMENFKGLVTPKMANPFKVLSKFSTRLRSRLALWVTKTIISNFLKMTENPPRRYDMKSSELVEGEDSLPRDTWHDLLNCFTGGSVSSASKLINLMYLGYLKNKNESPEGNTDFQLIEKTLEEELSLDRENLSFSKGEVPLGEQPKGKQFSKKCILYGCKLMSDKLKRTLGNNWKDLLGVEILDKLSESTTDTIASLKASSTIKHEDAPGLSSFKDPKASLRCKVLEAIIEKLDMFKLNPFTNLERFINYIELTSKGVIADLFKKQQHGGLREIYVLTIESRIVQLFIEIISRTICSYFDEETLTHPKNKLKKLNDHRRLSSRLSQSRGSLLVDLCSSSDKTRWNQNFVMPAMIIPLIHFTPNFYHNSIVRILNLWSNKLIRIPQSVVLHLLMRTPFQSPVYEQLFESFWAVKDLLGIFDFQAANCIRLQTGMMQGILHYTSSLLHLSFLYSSNRVILLLLKTWYPNYKFIMTQVCSSDDSAAVLSVLSPTDTSTLSGEFIKVSCHASLCLESLTKVCRYFCMVESVKSSISLIDNVEFNSEFMFNNTVAMPVIKFVAASLNMTESESFLDRFYTMYNLISDLFASGFSAVHTHLCQLSQAMFHYRTMGSSTNALFYEYVDKIQKWPDPKFGFFLLDTELIPGVVGFSYSHWNACTKTKIFLGSTREVSSDPWVTTPEGGLTQSLILKHGEVKRWKNLVTKVKMGIDLKEEIESDPSVLFRAPTDKRELHLKLCMNATSPGAAKSLRRGNPFIQSIAMSVYAINTHSFSKTTITQDLTGRHKIISKVCILGELNRLLESQIVQDRDISNSLMVSFPNLSKYEEIQKLILSLKGSTLIPCHRFRERKNEIVIQPRSTILPMSLMQVVKSRWFGFPSPASHKIYKKCLDIYKETIPWIRDTIQETLYESPFETYQELYHFICSNISKTRVFRRNGPGVHSKRLLGQLYNLIRKSQRPCHLLVESGHRRKPFPSQDMITKINLALSIPEKTFREGHVKDQLKKSPRIYEDLSSMLTMTKREATLGYLQGIIKEDFTKEEVAIHMREQGMGTHISYIKEQRKIISAEGVKWIGEGSCYVFVEGCHIHLTFKDEVLVKIEIDNWKRLRSNMFSFNNLVREMKLKPILDSGSVSRSVAKYNGSHFISNTGVGCPVLPLPEQKKIIFDPTELVIRIDHNELKLNQRVKSKYGKTILYEIPMLKYRLNHNDIVVAPKTGQIEKDLWSAWVNQTPCDVDTLFVKIHKALKDRKSILFSWLQDTLQSRLKFRNIGSFPLNYYETALEIQEAQEDSTEREEEDDELFKMIQEGLYSVEESPFTEPVDPCKVVKQSYTDIVDWVEEMERESQEAQQEAYEILQGLGLSDPLPLWVDYIKNWREIMGEESLSVVGPAYGSFLSVHSLWDEFIDGFSKEKDTFWIELCDGKIPYGYDEPARDLMDLLGIKVKSLASKRIGMSDRYKKALDLELALRRREEGALGLEGLMRVDEDNEEELIAGPTSDTTDPGSSSESDRDIGDNEIYSIFD